MVSEYKLRGVSPTSTVLVEKQCIKGGVMGYGLCLGDQTLENLIKLAKVDLFPSLWAEYQQCGHLKKCDSFREASDVMKIMNIMLRYCPQYRGGNFTLYWALDQVRGDGKTEDYSL